MIVSLIACALALQAPVPEKAQAVYDALQMRLSHAKTLYLTVGPTTGNAWDHETAYGFRRPNQAFATGYGIRRRTDGKRTSNNESTKDFNRPAKPGDMETFTIAGFESFTKPNATAVGIGDVRRRRVGGRDCLLLDLKIDGRPLTLFVDAETRLPSGLGFGEATEKDLAYAEVILDKAISQNAFKVAGPMPARTVYQRSQLAVAKFSTISIQRWTARHFRAGKTLVDRWVSHSPLDYIAGIKGGPYRRSGRGVDVIQNGTWIYRKLGDSPERWTKAVKERPPEPVPGFEEFFDPKHPAKVHGAAEIVSFCVGESYRVEALCAGKPTTIFIDTQTYMPKGFWWKANGVEEALFYGQVSPILNPTTETYFSLPTRAAAPHGRVE